MLIVCCDSSQSPSTPKKSMAASLNICSIYRFHFSLFFYSWYPVICRAYISTIRERESAQSYPDCTEIYQLWVSSLLSMVAERGHEQNNSSLILPSIAFPQDTLLFFQDKYLVPSRHMTHGCVSGKSEKCFVNHVYRMHEHMGMQSRMQWRLASKKLTEGGSMYGLPCWTKRVKFGCNSLLFDLSIKGVTFLYKLFEVSKFKKPSLFDASK